MMPGKHIRRNDEICSRGSLANVRNATHSGMNEIVCIGQICPVVARGGGSCEIGLDLLPERSVMAGHARRAGLASVTGHRASSQPTEADNGEIFFIQYPQAPRPQAVRE